MTHQAGTLLSATLQKLHNIRQTGPLNSNAGTGILTPFDLKNYEYSSIFQNLLAAVCHSDKCENAIPNFCDISGLPVLLP